MLDYDPCFTVHAAVGGYVVKRMISMDEELGESTIVCGTMDLVVRHLRATLSDMDVYDNESRDRNIDFPTEDLPPEEDMKTSKSTGFNGPTKKSPTAKAPESKSAGKPKEPGKADCYLKDTNKNQKPGKGKGAPKFN